MPMIQVHMSHKPNITDGHVNCEECAACSCTRSGWNILADPCSVVTDAMAEKLAAAASEMLAEAFEPVKSEYTDTDSMHEKEEPKMITTYVLSGLTPTHVAFKHVSNVGEHIRMDRDRWKSLGRPETLIAEFKGGDDE